MAVVTIIVVVPVVIARIEVEVVRVVAIAVGRSRPIVAVGTRIVEVCTVPVASGRKEDAPFSESHLYWKAGESLRIYCRKRKPFSTIACLLCSFTRWRLYARMHTLSPRHMSDSRFRKVIEFTPTHRCEP